MATHPSVEAVTTDIANRIPAIDRETTGQYGDGIGSENEERQLSLIVGALREFDDRYQNLAREVPYPNGSQRCDLVLPNGSPVEVKLIRYWRANGDPEPMMYGHVFSPFHRNTLLTDAKNLHESAFDDPTALLGLFYARSDDDPKTVESLPNQYTAESIAKKVVEDMDHWYGIDSEVREIARFDGLQHTVHKQGAVISWQIE